MEIKQTPIEILNKFLQEFIENETNDTIHSEEIFTKLAALSARAVSFNITRQLKSLPVKDYTCEATVAMQQLIEKHRDELKEISERHLEVRPTDAWHIATIYLDHAFEILINSKNLLKIINDAADIEKAKKESEAKPEEVVANG